MTDPKVLAFLLPQFHCIPENDAWWGQGFTEWTNVKRAVPLFRGHDQPRVPVSSNYYNLLDPATQAWQAALARSHGIHGFCYYHYWFNGKLLLEKPLQQMLATKAPDFPFCLAWANEPWTRTWDGGDSHVLMHQTYGGPEEWAQHFQYLLRAFQDPRYIRVNDKPVFLIYRTPSIVDCGPMLDVWQRLARQNGLPGLHMVSMLTYFEKDPRTILFDALVEFEPMHTVAHPSFMAQKKEQIASRLSKLQQQLSGQASRAKQSRDYGTLWRDMSRRPLPLNHYPGAFVDWDNSPRKGDNKSLVLRNVSIEKFETGFAAQYAKAQKNGSAFLFVNAWNEWAEGCYLEPDTVRGMAYLEAIQRVIASTAF
jgi:lipopolysaccharide biosynthesis protein